MRLFGKGFGVAQKRFELVARGVRRDCPVRVFRLFPRKFDVGAAARRAVPAACRNGDKFHRRVCVEVPSEPVGVRHLRIFEDPLAFCGVLSEIGNRARIDVVVAERIELRRRVVVEILSAEDHSRPVHGLAAIFYGNGVGLFQQLARFFRAAHVGHELRRRENRKIRLAVNMPIVGLCEIVFRAVFNGVQELLRSARERLQHLARLAVFGAERVAAVVVAPHDGEFHFAAVGGFQEALFERLRHRLNAVAVEVPVVQKHVDAAVRGKLDFLCEVVGRLAVQIAHQRLHRLLVPLEARNCGLDKFPFGPVLAEPLFAFGINVPVRVINADNLGFLRLRGRLGFLPALFRRATSQSARQHGVQY